MSDYSNELEYIARLALEKLEAQPAQDLKTKAGIQGLKLGMVYSKMATKLKAAKELYCSDGAADSLLPIPAEIWAQVEQMALDIASHARKLQELKTAELGAGN